MCLSHLVVTQNSCKFFYVADRTWHLEGQLAVGADFRERRGVALPLDLLALPVAALASHLYNNKINSEKNYLFIIYHLLMKEEKVVRNT